MARNNSGRMVRRFASGEQGNVAIIAALTVIPILTIAGFALDFQMATTSKTKIQAAADSASLAATKSLQDEKSLEEIRAEANAYFVASMTGGQSSSSTGFSKGGLSCGPLAINLVPGDLEGTQDVEVKVSCKQDTTLSRVAGKQYMPFGVQSSSTFGLGSIEVALILDTTGSMLGSRMTSLKTAATDFIDIVVKDNQTPFYSKVSIVPYAVAVNAGPYANNVRGAPPSGRSISDAVWQTGAQKSITAVNKANPARVTSNAHGFANGDRVWISGVNGMTQLNNKVYTVSNVAANTFRLQGVSSSGYSTYSSGGIIRKCLNTNCEVTVTSNNHGFADGEHIVVSGVNGMTQINTGTNATWQVQNAAQNTFVLEDSVGPTYSGYSNGGSAFCTTYGCQFYRFLNKASNAQRVHALSTCVTERTGAEALTDAAPSTALVGHNYPSTSNPCVSANEILPLTSNRGTLKAKVNALSAGGSTAGHLGAAWAWYTLSPNFGYLFPTASRGGNYDQRSLNKVAVLMTDGEYNSAYCNGVIAGDSTSGSGSQADQINCNATNGHAFNQALAYCESMKDAGIMIYTIGFEVVNDPRATQLVNECATSQSHVYMASGGDELRVAFQRIARSINEVRITR